MYVNHSGWNIKQGAFSYDIFFDETKTDFEVIYGDGFVSKQITPFEEVTGDWNHDGDVYTQFGAWFEGQYGGNTFLTPEDLVMSVLEARDRERKPYGNEIVSVKGVDIPLPEQRPNFDTVLRDSERRAANQEADRNRRMGELGIRPPNEPWAR